MPDINDHTIGYACVRNCTDQSIHSSQRLRSTFTQRDEGGVQGGGKGSFKAVSGGGAKAGQGEFSMRDKKVEGGAEAGQKGEFVAVHFHPFLTK